MVATTDAMFSNVQRHTPVFAPVRMVDGSRWLARGAQRFSGIVLVMAVVGLWLQPGAGFDQDVMLFKLAVSAFMALAGVALIQGAGRKPSVEVEIDLAGDALRLVRPGRTAAAPATVVQECSLSGLHMVDVDPCMVRMWDDQGNLLAEVPLSDPDTRETLLCALRAHGKI